MTVYEALERYFATVDWPSRPDPDARTITFPATGAGGTWLMRADARDDLPGLIVRAASPVPVPAEHRERAAVLIARLNDGLPFGNFELAHESGELRFKASVEASGDALSDEIIGGLVRAPVAVMNRFLPSLAAIASGATVERALELATH